MNKSKDRGEEIIDIEAYIESVHAVDKSIS